MVIPDNLKPSLKSPVIIKAKTKVSIVPINLQDKLFAICLLLKYNSFFYFYRATLQVFFNVIILNFYSSGNHPLSNTVLFASTSHLIASCLLPTIPNRVLVPTLIYSSPLMGLQLINLLQ